MASYPYSPEYYPPTNFHFAVYFGTNSQPLGPDKVKHDLVKEGMTFQSVSGLTVQLQTETIKEGGELRFEHVVPVRAKYGDLILKRGLVFQDTPGFQWLIDAFEQFQFEPKDLQVQMLNEDHEALVTWDVFHAWPKNWKFDEFNAESGKVFIETLELNYNSFRIREAK